MAKMYGKGKTAIESEDQQKLRWQVELEFVQCLANPNYLNFLAQRGYFKDQAFINYLKYLQYWKEPEYAKYLMYPMCLYFLDLLQYEHFRREIVNAQCCKFIDDQAILQWQHYTRKRIKMFNTVNGQMGQMNSTADANEQQQQIQQQQHQQQGTNAAAAVGGGTAATGLLNGIGSGAAAATASSGNMNNSAQMQQQQPVTQQQLPLQTTQQAQQQQQQQINGIGTNVSGNVSGSAGVLIQK